MSTHLRQSGGVSLMLGQLTTRRVNRDGQANAVEGHRSAQAVIADLGVSVTSDQVASTLVGGGTQLMGAIGCALVAIDDGVEPRIVRTSGRVTSFDSEQHPIAEVELHPFRDAVRSGEAVWVTSRHQYELRYPELATDEQASAWAVLPLTVNGAALGAIGWVFGQLDPVGFESIFRRFMAAFAAANKIDLGGIVAIDGKALRGAYERGKAATPMHLVNVFAGAARMVLASRKAPGRNEAKGALEVLAMLSRLLEAHEIVISKTRDAIEVTARNGDAGSNDLLTSDVLRRNELQVWFVAEHLVEQP